MVWSTYTKVHCSARFLCSFEGVRTPYERASSMEGDWLTYAAAAERLNTTPEAVRRKPFEAAGKGRSATTSARSYACRTVAEACPYPVHRELS